MKHLIFGSRTRLGAALGWVGTWVTFLLVSLLVLDSTALATTVTSLGGGPGPQGSRPWGYVDGNTASVSLFNLPSGMALDPCGTILYIADYTNNAVRAVLSVGDSANSQTATFVSTNYGVKHPVALAMDLSTNLYVLAQGAGTNGAIVKFDASVYSRRSTMAYKSMVVSNLAWATALAIDGLNTLYATVSSNTVIRVTSAGQCSTVGVITNKGTWLKGVAVLDNGQLALSDAGNHGIWKMDPMNGAAVQFSGFHGIGDVTSADPSLVSYHTPEMLAKAGNGILVVADRYNNKVKVVYPDGSDSRLYGISSNSWPKAGTGVYPGLYDGTVQTEGQPNDVEARQPLGVLVSPSGTVYTTEAYYHVLREAVGSTEVIGSTNLGCPPLFSAPNGVALNNEGTTLYIADSANSAIYALNLANNQTTAFLTAAKGLVQPVGVLVDANDSLYVLNQGTGNNGTLMQFDQFGNVGTNVAVSGLKLPTAFTRDASGNFVVCELAGAVRQFGAGISNTLVTLTNAGVQLQGIALFDDGSIVVSDSAHHVLWQVNPATKAVTLLSGCNGVAGNNPAYVNSQVLFNHPGQLTRAAGNLLLVADSGNNQLGVVNRAGAETNVLNSTNALVWFGRSYDPHGSNDSMFVYMNNPAGLAITGDGSVFVAEPGNHAVRKMLSSGLTRYVPGGVNSGTNALDVPTIAPASGYYPMGQWVTVSSPYTDVFYTTDGSTPTTNSTRLKMVGNMGAIYWHNPTNSLQGLQVVAFSGTNYSAVASGTYAAKNNIGIPAAPTPDGSIYGGIGSRIVVPVVANLQSNASLKTYQFVVEITPNGSAPMVSTDFQPLSISTNDFIPLITPGGGPGADTNLYTYYTNGATLGLEMFSPGSYAPNTFRGSAALTLLEVPIPETAAVGDTYNLVVKQASGTSDGTTLVTLSSMPLVTILVTNIPYLVGDTGSGQGGWYNAGSFGDTNLDNSDVNNAFYAASGLRIPYSFSDVYNAMDALGPARGDGMVRIEDWLTILNRSLRVDTNNWIREWNADGTLTGTPLGGPLPPTPQFSAQAMVSGGAPWYRQALLAVNPVSQAVPGTAVTVPVYVKLADGCSLSCLQFRALVQPQNGAPPLATSPVLAMASGLAGPFLAKSFVNGESAFGWNLNTLSFQSRSSNYLGSLSFTIPSTAQTGQTYRICLTNVDGLPALGTDYTLETRSAVVAVRAAAPAASLTSDEWKLHFFGSLNAATAADLADPDGDGVPNYMEYLAGTDPTDPGSRLAFSSAQRQVVGNKPQLSLNWLTAQGKAYEVQWTTNLTRGAWSTLTTISGNGLVSSCVDTNLAGPGRFYRVHVLP